MKKATVAFLIIGSCLGLMAQTRTVIKGRVLDSINHTPLPYVALFFEGSSVGDISNSGGEFTIHTNSDIVNNLPLKVMYSGYKTREIKLHADSLQSLQIYLSPTKKKEEIPALEVFRILGDEGRNPFPYFIYNGFYFNNPLITSQITLYFFRLIATSSFLTVFYSY